MTEQTAGMARVLGELERARGVAVALEQENAHLTDVLNRLTLWAVQQPAFNSETPILGATE